LCGFSSASKIVPSALSTVAIQRIEGALARTQETVENRLLFAGVYRALTAKFVFKRLG
jgi:hypothetical protein